MSLVRLVYYSALVGGWAAFLGWLVSEILLEVLFAGSTGGRLQVVLVGGIVGAAIGMGLNLVAGMANGQWKELARRSLPGLAGGGAGGALGGFLGDLLFAQFDGPHAPLGWPRALGWLIVGLGIGVVEGAYDRSKSKLRNGLVGGAIGGLVGGFLFDPIQQLIASSSGMPSRAVAFVIVGISIGAMIGLVQVVLKDAWLTVLDGYRAGRQLILSQEVTRLGGAEHLPLPFLGPLNKDLDFEHALVIRLAGGSYAVEDNHTRLGTRVNNQVIQGRAPLKDGDVIKLGTNFVRFNERHRRQGDAPPAPANSFQGRIPPAPPPPVANRPAATPPPLPPNGVAPTPITANPIKTAGASTGPSSPITPPPPPPSPKS